MTPLSIEIVPRNGGNYKSISTLSWTDIPGFAILTGKNGSGKTQLLEILAYHFSGARPPMPSTVNGLPVEVRTTGRVYSSAEIAFVPSTGRFSGGGAASLANMQQTRQQAIQHARQFTGNPNDIQGMIRGSRILNRLGGRNVNHVPPNELEEFLSDSDFATDDIDITAGLAHVFLAHRYKILEALDRNTPGIDDKGIPLGPAPWDVVNEALSVAGFPYEVISPSRTNLLSSYALRLKDSLSGKEIAALDLSSGEKVLLQLVLWLYTAGANDRFPKLLLLDEPDAHLHPSMTTQFLNVISDVLVNRYGVRVIITTHSPSTVALAPEGAVFQLERGANSVAKVQRRPDIISVLTAGLVTVSRTTKFCFVEDHDDVEFYDTLTEILTDHGPSRDSMALETSPSIAFIAASVGAGSNKIAGGHTIVRKWVGKLDADPLDRTFFGIIDRDTSNVTSGRIHAIGRYSFENYLLDPLNLFCLLLEQNTAPSVPAVNISSGNEHLLRLETPIALQAIFDIVTQQMEATEPALVTGARVSIHYTCGAQITSPGWVIDYRGHDLLPIAQGAFGGPGVVNPPRLLRAMRRGRLVPAELATLLRNIQAA